METKRNLQQKQKNRYHILHDTEKETSYRGMCLK